VRFKKFLMLKFRRNQKLSFQIRCGGYHGQPISWLHFGRSQRRGACKNNAENNRSIQTWSISAQERKSLDPIQQRYVLQQLWVREEIVFFRYRRSYGGGLSCCFIERRLIHADANDIWNNADSYGPIPAFQFEIWHNPLNWH